MKGFILGFITAALLFTALHYQFILTKKDLVVAPKYRLGLVNTYVDTRSWGPGDYLRHPGVTYALKNKGIGQTLEQAVGQAEKEANKAMKKAEKEVKKGLAIPAASKAAFSPKAEPAPQEPAAQEEASGEKK